MEAHSIADAALGGLIVGEPDLVLRDRHAVDLAAEALVGHEARAAATGAGVEQAVVGRDVAEVVEQDVGLRGLQPVQLVDDALVAVVVGPSSTDGSMVADPVVVVVEPVDVAEHAR